MLDNDECNGEKENEKQEAALSERVMLWRWLTCKEQVFYTRQGSSESGLISVFQWSGIKVGEWEVGGKLREYFLQMT